jgi:hypothetical protein
MGEQQIAFSEATAVAPARVATSWQLPRLLLPALQLKSVWQLCSYPAIQPPGP